MNDADLIKQIEDAVAAGQMGNRVDVKDPETGKVLQSFGSAQSAYEAGVLARPGIYGIMDKAPVYKATTGGWTTMEPTESSIELDKLTGDINVKVPSYVANDPEFQATLDTYKQYSSAYKLNPDGKVTVKNSDGSSEGVSISEYIERLNTPVDTGQKDDEGNEIKITPFQSHVNEFVQLNMIREFFAPKYQQIDDEGNVTPINLTRTDVIRMTANGLGKDVKDDTRIAVPKGISLLDDIYNDESWDDATSTTTYKKFRELWYNREKTNKQDILTVYGELGRYLNEATKHPTQAQYVDSEKFTAAYALYTFMSESDPTCSMFRASWDALGSVVNAAGQAAVNYYTLGVQVLSGVAEKVVDLTVNLFENGLSQNPFEDRSETDFTKWARDTQEVMDTKFWAQQWGYGIGEFEKAANAKQQLAQISEGLKGVLGIGVDEETAARFATDGADPNLNSTADSIRKVGTSLIQLAIAIHIGNVLEGTAKGLAKNIGAQLATDATTISSMVKAGTASWVAIAGAKGTAQVLNLVAKLVQTPVAVGAIGLAGESIGEAIFQSPEVLAQILQSDDLEPEAQAYLWDTFTGNAVALIGATAVSKGAQKIGETAWGKAASRNLRNNLWRLEGKLADSVDAIRIKLSGAGSEQAWLDKIGSKGLTDAGRSRHAQKEAIMAQQRTLRRARQAIAESSPSIKILGETKESILKQIDEADNIMGELMEYEKAIDDIARGNNFTKLEMLEDHPLFDSANGRLQRTAGEVVELQTEAGLKAADKVGKLRLFAPEVSEYINARIRSDIGNNVIKVRNASTAVNATVGLDVVEKEVAHWGGVISDFQQKYSPELVAKAEDYIAATKDWWRKFNDMRLQMGLISEIDVAKWREEGVWGENGELYARQQRVSEQSDYIVRRRDGKVTRELVRDMGHYNWGKTESFVDPMIVAQQEFELAAEQFNRVEAMRTYSNITGTATVVKDAADVRVAKEARPYLKSYNNEAHAAMKKLVDEMDANEVFDKAITRHQISAEAKATDRALGQANRAITSKAITKGEAQTAILSLDDDGVEQLWGSTYGTKTIEEVTGNPESATNSMRTILANSKEARESAYMRDIITPAREQQIHQTVEYAYLADTERSLEAMQESADFDLDSTVADVMGDFKATYFANGSNAHKVADEIAMRYGGAYPDTVKDYLYYDALRANKANLAKQVKARAKSYFSKYEVEVDGKTTRPYKARAEYLANEVSKRVSGRIDVEYNASRVALSNMGGDASKLIDHDSWQREIYETANEIADLQKGDNIIAIPDESGEMQLVEVDPLLSTFINSTNQYTPLGVMGRVNYLWMRLFRLGTTGMNPTSWVNQYYRDLGNAWVMGNVGETLGSAVNELSEIFGADAGHYLAQYSQEVQENLLKVAADQDKGLAQVIAGREIRRGALYAQASSESEMTRLWRGTKNQWIAGSQKRSGWDKTMDAFDKVEGVLSTPNEVREKYLRNLVYGNNFADAIKGGKSIEQARIFAEYIASNATTNFTRGVAFMNQFQNTIPYFRSAINGTRSFYRLWSLDPVGVTGRIVGGLILPAFALTMSSLSTEQNRKAYKKIQAYQKEDALPIVVDGQAFFIPLPQELSAFINPFRQAAEAINGLGYNNALEVAVNDLLDLSPVDFGGFTDIDSWRIYGEGPDWGERLSRGSAQLFSQIMPKWATAVATAASGRDLYTGNKIDTSYVTVDPDTGEQRIMSYTAGVIANQLNKVFPNLAAPIAQEMLENIFGVAGAQVMDFLAGMVEQTATGNFNYASVISGFGTTVLQDMAKPMRPYTEPREQADWRRAVSDLWDLHANILSPSTPEGQAWQAMLTNKRNATTQTERDAVAAARANILDPYYKQVMETVQNLIKADPTAFTDIKMASVMALMNFGIAGDTVNSAASESAREIYNQSKYAAVETMVKLGFPNVSNPSIFGTIKTSASGGTYIQWNTPLQILDMENTMYAQGAIYAADIKNLLKKNGITNDGLSAAWDKYDAAKTKEEKRKIAVDWDIQVATAIAPYVNQYGAESVSNSNDVIDLLDGYLMIPSDYMRYRGKSTYNPRVNANRGYSKQFIKDIFGAKK